MKFFGLLLALSIVSLTFCDELPGSTQPFLAGYGAVASANRVCNEMGVEILKKGGNAADAAITSALCLSVQHIFESGIGGGGIMLIAMNGSEPISIDCRETATSGHYEGIFRDVGGNSSWDGGLSTGIPGELKCLQYAFKNYKSGKLTWKQLFEPVIKLARSFEIHKLLFLRLDEHQGRIFKDPGLSEIFVKDGEILKEGDMASNEKLAKTLETLSEDEELESFYHGDIMKNMVDEINAAGGNVTEEDFKTYEIAGPEDNTYKFTYRGFTFHVPKLPFTGSLMMAQSLKMLENMNLTGANLLEERHIIIETMKFGFANRLAMGDLNFGYDLAAIEESMLSGEHGKELFDKIDLNQTFPPEYYLDLYGDTLTDVRDAGTEHISVVDMNGNAVSFTTSINYGWGAGYRGNTTGITYNNIMDDFNIPGSEYKPNSRNYPEPGKRPLSTMTPTIIYDSNGDLFLVTGASGGARIYAAVMLTVIDVIDYKLSLNESVNKVRPHHQLTGDLLYESFVTEEEKEYMVEKGHSISYRDRHNIVNSIHVIREEGKKTYLYALSDWRKYSQAQGYGCYYKDTLECDNDDPSTSSAMTRGVELILVSLIMFCMSIMF